MARTPSSRAPDPDLSDDDIQESRKRKRVSAASSSSHLEPFEDCEDEEEGPEEEDEDGDQASSSGNSQLASELVPGAKPPSGISANAPGSGFESDSSQQSIETP